MTARRLAAMLGVATVVVAADAVSKALALRHVPGPGRPGIRLLDGLLTLKLTLNPGAAFGVGTSYTAVIALIACGVVIYLIRIAGRLRSLAWSIALGLLLGGAAGNLGDRLFRAPGPLRGSVVDWLNLPHFPWTFNLADAAITCAAVLIAILSLSGIRIDATSSARAPGAPHDANVSHAPRAASAPRDASAPCASSAPRDASAPRAPSTAGAPSAPSDPSAPHDPPPSASPRPLIPARPRIGEAFRASFMIVASLRRIEAISGQDHETA